MSLAIDFILQIVLTCTLTPLHTNPRTATTFYFPTSWCLPQCKYILPYGAKKCSEYLSHWATFRKKPETPVRPAYCMSTPLIIAQPHVTLPFTCQLTSLTPPLWRDLLSYLTFATIKHHPCLVEKLECLIQRNWVHSLHTNATKSIEGPLVRTDR